MKTKIISIVIGNFAGGIVLILMNMLNQNLYPLPPDVTIANTPALAAYLASMPMGAFLLSFFGMLLAGLAGGFFATIADPVNGKRNSLLVALLFTLFGVTGMLMVAHPLSLWIINLCTYIPWASAGNRLALAYQKRTA
jgi:hypothetical protein